MVRGAHRRDFRAQGRERAVEEELRRHHAGPGGEARYHRGGGGRGQQRDVRAGPGGGHARPAGGSPARGHLSCHQPRQRQLVRFRARDLSHRGEEHDGAAGALDPFPAQGEAPGAGGPNEYPTAAAAPVAGRAGGLPHAGWLTLSGKRSVKWVRGLGRSEGVPSGPGGLPGAPVAPVNGARSGSRAACQAAPHSGKPQRCNRFCEDPSGASRGGCGLSGGGQAPCQAGCARGRGPIQYNGNHMKFKLAVSLAVLAAVVLGQQPQRRERPVRLAARGTRGAVAGGTEYATEAGMRMYTHGGNAVDAGVATMLAAAVVEFSHFGLGGEAPILVRTKDGKVHAIAGVGTMPKLATAQFFREHKLTDEEMVSAPEAGGMKDWVRVAGILAALVPGMVEAALVTLREYGTKSFAEIVEPAIELADGFPIDELRVTSIVNSLTSVAHSRPSPNVPRESNRSPLVCQTAAQSNRERSP